MPAIIGKGSYGEVTVKDGKAVKKFSKLSHLIQECAALKYLHDCDYIVKISGVNFHKLELHMNLYDCSLRHWLEENSDRSDNSEDFKADLMKITHDILIGLIELHDRGLAHADLKPGNILICKKPLGAVLGDCGFVSIAKYAKVDRTAAIYRDPKIEFNITHDMYSLGLILLELFGCLRLNRQPHNYDELKEVINTKISDTSLKKIIYNLLHPDKSRRPTAKTVLNLLFHETPPKWNKSSLCPSSNLCGNTPIMKDIRPLMKKAAYKYQISRCKIGYRALLTYLENNKITSDLHRLYIGITLMILSAIFGASGFNERSINDFCDHKYSSTTIYKILDSLISDKVFISMLLYPSE